MKIVKGVETVFLGIDLYGFDVEFEELKKKYEAYVPTAFARYNHHEVIAARVPDFANFCI